MYTFLWDTDLRSITTEQEELKMDIRIKKADATVEVQELKFNQATRDFLYNYGVRQFLNDSISDLSREGSKSTTKASSDEMLARVNDTIERLYAGETKARRAVDSLGKMAFSLATKKVMNRWLKAHPGGNVIKDYATRAVDASKEYEANKSAYDEMAASLIELTQAEEV
jgi:hypothetical protein